MQRTKSDLIHEKREVNKISLETFVLDKHNVLDYPVDKLIKDLGKKLKENWKEHNVWINMENENPERYNELKEQASYHDHSLDDQLHNYIIEITDLDEEINALLEVKIIYAFKHLEINLKRLIKAAYNDDSFSKNYKWEYIRQYLSLKKIELRDIDCYSDINQLRELNNSIKHSENYIENVNLKRKVPELNKEKPSSRDLYRFYERVKKSPNTFLESLSCKIHDDLYSFNEEKLNKIAESLSLRMDKNQANQLIEMLKENY